MKSRYPLASLRVPALLGLLTAFALLVALLNDGGLETVSIGLLAGVITLIGFCLTIRRSRH